MVQDSFIVRWFGENPRGWRKGAMYAVAVPVLIFIMPLILLLLLVEKLRRKEERPRTGRCLMPYLWAMNKEERMAWDAEFDAYVKSMHWESHPDHPNIKWPAGPARHEEEAPPRG